MINIIFFEGKERNNLLPLTFIRPVSELLIGGMSFKKRWQLLLDSTQTSDRVQENYLSKKYPSIIKEVNLFINPAFFPNEEILAKIKLLKIHECLIYNNHIVAYLGDLTTNTDDERKYIFLDETPIWINFPWDLFTHNFHAIEYDFQLLTKNKISKKIPSTVNVIGDCDKIYIEEGAELNFCTLNTKNGSIFIGKDAEIMEGSTIRGNFFLGTKSIIKMGSKVYEGCSIGENCKVGGEISNSIIMSYSNKGHDGFLGNSVIGEWCNLGADTNTSNLKNNYSEVKCWSYIENEFIKTGLQFSGLIMGDHSKSAINTQFNTGTICGVSANIFCQGFPSNIIPHFSWGGKLDSEKFLFKKALEAVEKTMERRNISLSTEEIEIFKFINDNY